VGWVNEEFGELDDALTDGRLTEDGTDFYKKFNVKGVMKKVKEIKRPLTDEELEAFRIK
jgi:hypothetical protein